MGHVAPALADLTARAQTLSSAGDLRGAREVLDHALDPGDTDPQRATPDLAAAAALHAKILIMLGDAHAARIWAGFAHAAEERLHGPHDDRTLSAAALHAAVLARVGNHGRAAQLYHDLVRELIAREGPDSHQVLSAEADLATAEHAAGHCTAARDRLGRAATRYRQVYGDATPNGIKMLARLGAMERECGRLAESHQHLALAQELCARHLPADHPLVGQIAALAAAAASGRHVCGRVRRSEGPAPAERAPAPIPPAAPALIPPAGPARKSPAEPARTRPAAPPYPVPPPASESPPIPAPRPQDDDTWPQDLPDDRVTDPKGAIYQQPLYLSEVHQAPGDLTGRHARADTPLPMPGRRRPEYTPDGRRVPVGSAPVGMPDDPVDHDRRLPVPVPRAGDPPSRQPFVLAAVLVAGIGVAAAVVAVTLPRGEAGTPGPAATTTAAPPASTTAGAGAGEGAPAGVALRDNRDSVSLTWTYPKGSEGPVLISGGRAGQDRKAFQQLPAGSTDYVVYGLNNQLDYCFTVAVVHSTDDIAASAPICTAR